MSTRDTIKFTAALVLVLSLVCPPWSSRYGDFVTLYPLWLSPEWMNGLRVDVIRLVLEDLAIIGAAYCAGIFFAADRK